MMSTNRAYWLEVAGQLNNRLALPLCKHHEKFYGGIIGGDKTSNRFYHMVRYVVPLTGRLCGSGEKGTASHVVAYEIRLTDDRYQIFDCSISQLIDWNFTGSERGPALIIHPAVGGKGYAKTEFGPYPPSGREGHLSFADTLQSA
jgi:hypothetical protein